MGVSYSTFNALEKETKRTKADLAEQRRQNKELIKQVEDLSKKLDKLIEKSALEYWGKNVKPLCEVELKNGQPVVSLVGKVDAGKSCLVNALTAKTEAKTGQGSTTAYVRFHGTAQDNNGVELGFQVQDTPGDEEGNKFEDDKLKEAIRDLLNTTHVLCIVYTGAVSDIEPFIRIAVATNRPYVLVRNKLDLIRRGDVASWAEVMQADKAAMSKFEHTKVDVRSNVFGISAANAEDVFAFKEGPVERYQMFEWQSFSKRLAAVAGAAANSR